LLIIYIESSIKPLTERRKTKQITSTFPRLTDKHRIEDYKNHLNEKRRLNRKAKPWPYWYLVHFWFAFTFLGIVNIFACILVILSDMAESYSHVWDTIEVVLMAYFILEFIILVIMKRPPRIQLLYSIETYIDIISFSPRLIILVFGINKLKRLTFFRILRVFKVFRVVKIINYLDNIGRRPDDLNETHYNNGMISPLMKEILILIISLFSTLFISAGFIVFIDDTFNDAFSIRLNYIDAIYYIAVTASTLGYGDIFPKIEISRYFIMAVIVILIYIFAVQVDKIATMMKSRDSYDLKLNLKLHDVIFLYDDNLEILTSFLLYYFRFEKDSYNEEIIKTKRTILIISNREKGIDTRIKAFMNLKIFEGRIKYIPSKGSVDRRLIDNGCLKEARAIYFLCNPTSEFGNNQDKMSIIYSHFMKNHRVRAEIFIQTATQHSDFRNWEELERSRRYSVKSSINLFYNSASSVASEISDSGDITRVLEIVCTQKLIMQSMARNVFYDGFVQSISTMLIDELESGECETFCTYAVEFPSNCFDITFEEC
jgi:voltage-gated potassium channel